MKAKDQHRKSKSKEKVQFLDTGGSDSHSQSEDDGHLYEVISHKKKKMVEAVK